jgi:hypothetical protein
MNLILNPPLLGFIVGTRAALAFGVGLLVAERIPESKRRAIGATLVAVGALSTIPAAIAVIRRRTHELPSAGCEDVLIVATVEGANIA